MGGRPEGPGSIPPSRAFSKTPTKLDVWAPEAPKVVFWATNEKRTRGASPGLVFWVHRKSEGRRGSRARLAQWLGARLGGGRNRAVPGSIPPSRGSASPGLLLYHKNFGKNDVLGVGLGSVWGRFGVGLGSVWDRFGVSVGPLWNHCGITFGKLLTFPIFFPKSSGNYSPTLSHQHQAVSMHPKLDF